MSKLTLLNEGRALREFAVDSGLTIGRLPDNVVVIDNRSVSAYHARVVREGDRLVLEDLDSTNGTFVNGQPVTRHVLRHGDEVLVGRHRLVFDGLAAWQAAAPTVEGLDHTVCPDAQPHRARRATLEASRSDAGPATTPPVSARRLGVLRVVSGRADRPEYDLTAHTSLIGRSSTALVRLRGWLKPAVAVAIARGSDGYVATRMGGRVLVNDRPLTGRRRLEDGDLLQVGGLILEFAWRSLARESAA